LKSSQCLSKKLSLFRGNLLQEAEGIDKIKKFLIFPSGSNEASSPIQKLASMKETMLSLRFVAKKST